MTFDGSSPGYRISIVNLTDDLRVRGRHDPLTRGQIRELTTDVTDFVYHVTFEDSEKDLDVLKLRVDNHDLRFFETPQWMKGNLVRFFYGYPGRLSRVRYMVVDSFKGFRDLTITCIERTAAANEANPRKFENKKRHEVVKQLVSEGRFPGVIHSVVEVVANEEAKDWSQGRLTDWQYVQRLAEEPGFVVYIDGNELHFHRRRLDLPPTRTYTYFTGDGLLLDFSVTEWKVSDRAAEATKKSRDPIARENRTATGSDSNTDRATLGNQNTLRSRPNAGGRLVSANEDRPAGSTVDPSPNPDLASVRAHADAAFRLQEEDEIHATAKLVGDPDLEAKIVIDLRGISTALSGKYYVEKARHELDDKGGYETHLVLLKNASLALPSIEPPTLDSTKAKENTKTVAEPRRLVLTTNSAGDLIQKEAGR